MKVNVEGKDYEINIDPLTLKEWLELNPTFADNIKQYLTEEKLAGGSVPVGYEPTGEGSMCKPIPDKLKYFIETLDSVRFSNRISLSASCGVLRSKGLDFNSTQTVTNVLDRCEQALGFLKPLPKSVELKMKGKGTLEKLKVKRQRRIAARELVISRKRKEEIKRLEQKEKLAKKEAIKNAKAGLMSQKEIIEANKPTNGLQELIDKAKTSSKDIDYEIPEIQEERLLFKPTPKQSEFLAAPEKVVLYGGAAGG